jgi:hypothetical protein
MVVIKSDIKEVIQFLSQISIDGFVGISTIMLGLLRLAIKYANYVMNPKLIYNLLHTKSVLFFTAVRST